MPNRAFVISKNDLIRWKDPRQLRSAALHDVAPAGGGGFQLHECGFLPDCGDWNYDGLCNPFWRLYYNGKKGSAVVVAGRRLALSPGELLIIPENTPFDSRGASGVPHLWVHFSPPLVMGLAHEVRRVPLTGPMGANLAALRECLAEAVPPPEGKWRLYQLTLSLLHAWAAEMPGPGPGFPPALGAVLERIERSLPGDLSNALLASQAAMSLEGFIRWFKEWTGATPARYVARRRIREACRLLLLSDASIEEIAEATGFANRHHFSRVFLRYTRRGPAQFRREERRW